MPLCFIMGVHDLCSHGWSQSVPRDLGLFTSDGVGIWLTVICGSDIPFGCLHGHWILFWALLNCRDFGFAVKLIHYCMDEWPKI